jgi:hypothetical protein
MIPRYLEVRTSFPKTPSERIRSTVDGGSPDRPEVFDAERGAARKPVVS